VHFSWHIGIRGSAREVKPEECRVSLTQKSSSFPKEVLFLFLVGLNNERHDFMYGSFGEIIRGLQNQTPKAHYFPDLR